MNTMKPRMHIVNDLAAGAIRNSLLQMGVYHQWYPVLLKRPCGDNDVFIHLGIADVYCQVEKSKMSDTIPMTSINYERITALVI